MTEKVVLGDIISGYNLSLINDNFQKIEDELNNNVLYRDAPEGAPNQLEVDIDANGKRIYNLPKPTSMNEPVRVFDLLNASDVVPVTKWFVDKFVGNSSTTVFPLTNETQSDGSVFVYFDGLAKTLNTDYTVVDNEVVFTVAPAIGVNVVVHYGIFVGSEAGVTSVGSGASIVKDGDGVLRSIQGIGEVSVNVNGDVVEVGTNAQNNIGVSLGTGAPVYAGKTGATLQFKSLKAGTNVTLTESADSITVAATGTGVGESNTASNVGTGSGVFKAKDGVDLKFKSLKAGANVTLTPSADEVLIEASGSGGGTPFADISAYGAVGDFVPAAGSTGTGTINDGSVNSAISSGKPLWIPAGNFLVSSAVQTALNNVTTTGPGTLWISTNVGITKMGKMLVLGTNRSHEMQSVGGIKLGGESGEGIRQWMGHHNWMQWQPTKYGAPAQLQIYSNAVMAQASCVSPNILNARNGTTFDTTKIDVGDHFGWNGAVYKIASVTSSQITCTTLAGASPAFVTNATARPFFHAYETSTGTVNTSGTAVTYASGEQFPYGYTGDHMTARINGTLYTVSLGPESLNANSLTLASSAGTQTGVSCIFKRGYGPWAYVSLLRLQGLAGGYETNCGMYLNIKNEAVIFNGATHSNLNGNMRINAVRTRIGNDDGSEQVEVGSNYTSLGGYFGSEGLRVVPTSGAVNRIEAVGAATTFAPVLAVRGADTNPDMGFDLQGSGTFRFTAGTFGRTVCEVFAPAGTTVWPTLAAGAGAATVSVNSALTNADLVLSPKGTTGKLRLKGVPFCMLRRTTAVLRIDPTTQPRAQWTMYWDAELADTFAMHAAGAKEIYAPVAGLYAISAGVDLLFYGGHASGQNRVQLRIYKNGVFYKASPYYASDFIYSYTAGASLVCDVQMAAGDYVELSVVQFSYSGGDGHADYNSATPESTFFDMRLITEI